MEKRGVRREDLTAFAGELGIRAVGFLSAEQWKQAEDLPQGTAPNEVWPLVKSIIVIGIPYLPTVLLPAAREFGGWDVRNGILDTAAYRLSLYLNRQGYPSVNIPSDASGEQGIDMRPVPVFSHRQAAAYAGLIPSGDGDIAIHTTGAPSWQFASVFTSLDFEGREA
jgi:epoxyqueuosine reductase QueG